MGYLDSPVPVLYQTTLEAQDLVVKFMLLSKPRS